MSPEYIFMNMKFGMLTKKQLLKFTLIVWIILWMFFLVREDKDGQYKRLAYFYTHGYGDNSRYIMGPDLYDFLVFSRRNIPDGSTYQLIGFERFSIAEVRARYFLWPLRSVSEDAEFKIFYGGKDAEVPGYVLYRDYDGKGVILVKEGGVR